MLTKPILGAGAEIVMLAARDRSASRLQALTDLRIPVGYVVYPREGHGISEPAHVRDLLERNLRWFLRWLSAR